MPTALRAFVVVPVSLILFVFAEVAFAQINADEADDMCPPVTEKNVYKSYKPHLAEFEEGGKKYFNLYGTICKDIEGKQVAANGICIEAHVCQAKFCGGKPCALPPIQMKDIQKSVYGDSASTPPAQTVPPVGTSLLDAAVLTPTTPLDQQKAELAPSTDSFKKIMEQGKEPGVVDKLWNYVFEPNPIDPTKDTFRLQPTKYDDFGNEIPQTVGPQNTITNPKDTFGEPQTVTPSTETPWWKSAWNDAKEAWGSIAEEFGFGAQAAPEQNPSGENSPAGLADATAALRGDSVTDENAFGGDNVSTKEPTRGPEETLMTKNFETNNPQQEASLPAVNEPRDASAKPLQAEPDGRIDPQKVYEAALKKVESSELNGKVPEESLRKLGVNGSPESWAKLFTQLQQQESGNRIADVNSDGSLKKFSTTAEGEQSYGPGQFNKGEYGLKTWADVNNPDKVLDAYIKVAEAGKMGAYFGPVQNPQLITQHDGWFTRTVDTTGGNYDPFTQRGDFSKFTFDTGLQNQSFPEPQIVNYFSGDNAAEWASVKDNDVAYTPPAQSDYLSGDNIVAWSEIARNENLASNDSLSGGRVGTGDEDIVFAGPTKTEISSASKIPDILSADNFAEWAEVARTENLASNNFLSGDNADAWSEVARNDKLATNNFFSSNNDTAWTEVARNENLASNNFLSGDNADAWSEVARNENLAGNSYLSGDNADAWDQTKLDDQAVADQQKRDAELQRIILSDQAAYDAADKQSRDEKLADVIASDQKAYDEANKQAAADEVARNAVDNDANDAERRVALEEYDKQKAAEVESARKLEEARHAVDNAANDSERRTALEEYDKQKAAAEEVERKNAGPKYYDAFGTEYSSPKVAEVSDKLQLKEAELGVKLEAAKAELEKAKADRAAVPWYEKALGFNFTNDSLKTQDAVKLAQKNVDSLTAELKKADAAVTALQQSPYAEAVTNSLLTQPTKPEEIIARNALTEKMSEYADAVKTLDQFNRDPQAFVAGAGGDEVDSIRKGLQDRVNTLNTLVGEYSGAIKLSAESEQYIKQSVEAQKSVGQLASEVFSENAGTALNALKDKGIAFLGEAQRGFAEPGVYSGFDQAISLAGITKGLIADPVANVLQIPTPETQLANQSKNDVEKVVSHTVDIAIVATPFIAPAIKGFGMLSGALDVPKIGALDLTAAKVGGEAVDFATADSRIIAGAVGREASAGSGLGDAGAAASRNASELAAQTEREIAAARPTAPVDTVPPATDVRVLTSEPVAPPRPVEPARVPTEAEIDRAAVERMAGEGPTPVKTPAAEPVAPKSAESVAPTDVVPAAESKSWWQGVKERFGYGEETPTVAETPKAAVAPEVTPAPKVAEAPAPRVEPAPAEIVPTSKPVEPAVGAPEPVLPKAVEPVAAEKPSFFERWFGKSETPAAAETPKAAVAPEVTPTPKAAEVPTPRAEPTPAEVVPTTKPVEPVVPAPEVASAAEKSWLGKKWDDLKSSFGYGEKPPAQTPLTQAERDALMAGDQGPVVERAAAAPKPAEPPAPRAEPAPAETTPPARGTGEPAPIEPVKRGSGDVSKPNAEIAMGDEGPVALKPGAENPSGKVWNDKTLTRDEFIADYKAAYPKTTLTDAQLAERYAAGKRLNPQTGQLKVPETPVPVAGTPAAPAVAGTPSLLSRGATWVGNNKIKTIAGLVVGSMLLDPVSGLYNWFTSPSSPESKTPAAPVPPAVAPPAPKAEVPPPPVVRREVLPPPITRRGDVPIGAPTPDFGSDYCIVSINPVIVWPGEAARSSSVPCYNKPSQNPAWRTFPPIPPPPPASTQPTSSTRPPVTPTPTPTPPPTPTTTPPVLKPYATLIANPPTVLPGRKSRLIWSSINTSRCELFAPGNNSMATSTRGSTSTLPLATTTQFMLNCNAASGATTSAQTTVTVH